MKKLKDCVPLDLPLRGVLLSKFLELVSKTCDKKADIDFGGKRYIVREVQKKQSKP